MDGRFVGFLHIIVEARRSNIVENDLFWVGNGRLIRCETGASPNRRDPRIEVGHFPASDYGDISRALPNRAPIGWPRK
jgi:hypothetical protein